MKRTTLFITSLVLMVGCSKDPINESTLIDRNGLMYEVNGQEPYIEPVFLL